MVEKSSEEEDYKKASHSTADYADYQSPKKERNPLWRKVGIWGGIVVAIIILAAGGYMLIKNHKSSNNPSSNDSQTSQTNQAHSTAKISAATKHYDSANFNLGFDYPADWTVSDTDNGQLTVKSPTVGLKDTSGHNVSAIITMTIRRNDQKLSEFDKGDAIATLDSEKVAYTKPTQTQRANTYLSFLTYSGSNGISGIYITGDNGYKKAQAIPKADIQKVDPIVSVTFTNSESNTAFSISIDNWSDPGFADPIKNMLQSLSIT
jgi:hypothetical protein